MKIRVISLLLALVLALLFIPTSARTEAATATKEESILQQIRDTYRAAQRGSGIYSFNGLCGTMVSWQTYLLGMDEKMYPYDGNKAFDAYRWKEYSGEYSVESYPASRYNLRSALNTITQNGTVDAYNILVGFQWTHTSAGARYGHAVFIHAILDGTVYFMESYNATVGGKYYSEGTPISCSIDTFCKYYSTWTALDGVIHFGVKNFADLCENVPANMMAMCQEEVSAFAEPHEEADAATAEETARLPMGKHVTVRRLCRTPGGSYWYECYEKNATFYVRAENLVPVEQNICDVIMESPAIPGVIRKSAGAVLHGVLSSRTGALDRVEVQVIPAGENESVLEIMVETNGAVYLSDKVIDDALRFRELPVGSYDIVIRVRTTNYLLKQGEVTSCIKWTELWRSNVQIVSGWDRYATVRFNGNGGAADVDLTAVPVGGALTQFPTATREGHVFAGWSLSPDGSRMVDGATIFSKDTTLYAVWQRENDDQEAGGWTTVNGVLFYQDKDGNVPSGWTLVDGEFHYFNEVGAAMSGWQEIGGSRYYLNDDGSKVWGWQTIGENRYYFRFDGMQHSTWLAQGKNLYYLDETGKMVTGSKKIGKTECHFSADGNLCMTKEENGSVKQYVVYDRQAANEYLEPDEMALLG